MKVFAAIKLGGQKGQKLGGQRLTGQKGQVWSPNQEVLGHEART